MQEMVEKLTSAIIRTPSGRQIVVEWGAQSEEQRVANVIKQFYDQFNEQAVIKDNNTADKQADLVHIIEENNTNDKKGEELEAVTTSASPETSHEEQASNTNNQGSNTDHSKQNETNKKETNKNEVNKKEEMSKEAEVKSGEENVKNASQVKNSEGSNKGNQNQTTAGATMNLKAKSNEVVLKTNYFLSLRTALQLQSSVGGKIQKNGCWVDASQEEIKKYFLPNDENINKYKYQFLSLKATAGISEAEAAKFLKGKGILSGKAAIFLDAAKKNNINEIYLMAHACLETGNGKSQLATGVKYKGQVVYNMFGVGAYDNSAVTSGARYAYNAGWTTPEKAIYGGAKFISENYINHATFEQDTLYEMRWNPGSPSKHQYATDVAWAAKQSVWMEQIYKTFDDPHVTFDIPVYRAGTGY